MKSIEINKKLLTKINSIKCYNLVEAIAVIGDNLIAV
jgi:hypothetical protein